jgi:hypothetical protein
VNHLKSRFLNGSKKNSAGLFYYRYSEHWKPDHSWIQIRIKCPNVKWFGFQMPFKIQTNMFRFQMPTSIWNPDKFVWFSNVPIIWKPNFCRNFKWSKFFTRLYHFIIKLFFYVKNLNKNQHCSLFIFHKQEIYKQNGRKYW